MWNIYINFSPFNFLKVYNQQTLFPPKLAFFFNGWIPIPKPRVSSGVRVQLLSHCYHAALPMRTHQNNNSIFVSSSCLSSVLFIFRLPLSLFLTTWPKQFGWKSLWGCILCQVASRKMWTVFDRIQFSERMQPLLSYYYTWTLPFTIWVEQGLFTMNLTKDASV